MLDGKIFFGVTGTPRRNIALVKSALADAEPVPLTFAKRTTKSLILIVSEVARGSSSFMSRGLNVVNMIVRGSGNVKKRTSRWSRHGPVHS